MSEPETHETSATVLVEGTNVVEVKPDGSELNFTAEAALETGGKLIEAAAKAEGKRRLTR